MGISFARHVKEMDRLKKFHNKEKAVLFSVLKQAREKLEVYRDHSSGEYHGGIEHTALIRNINQALTIVPPPVFHKPKPLDPYYLHRPIQEELCLRYFE